MTDEEINIAIAEVSGIIELDRTPGTEHFSFIPWRLRDGRIVPEDELADHVPDYCNDLNALNEAALGYLNRSPARVNWAYCEHLGCITGSGSNVTTALVHATAAQHAEAFLRTIGKWEDSTK